MSVQGPAPRPPTILDLLLHQAAERADQTLYSFQGDDEGEETPLSYAELDRRARRIAASLQEVARPGARVVLLYPPGPDYVAGFFGCLYAGMAAVPAYPPDPMRLARTLPRLHAIIDDAQ